LNPLSNESSLLSLFERTGQILSVRIVRDGYSYESVNIAFVTFGNAEDVIGALIQYNLSFLDDYEIIVDFCHKNSYYFTFQKR